MAQAQLDLAEGAGGARCRRGGRSGCGACCRQQQARVGRSGGHSVGLARAAGGESSSPHTTDEVAAQQKAARSADRRATRDARQGAGEAAASTSSIRAARTTARWATSWQLIGSYDGDFATIGSLLGDNFVAGFKQAVADGGRAVPPTPSSGGNTSGMFGASGLLRAEPDQDGGRRDGQRDAADALPRR
jgi:hypothetical protein